MTVMGHLSSPHPVTGRIKPLNVCIASPEFIGLSAGTETCLAYTAMAHALAAAGHRVTCLYFGCREAVESSWEQWTVKYRRDGLSLVALPPVNASDLAGPPDLIKSYEIFHWLKRNDSFDIIHFPDRDGAGYHTLMAKQQRAIFQKSTICVGLHSLASRIAARTEEEMKQDTEIVPAFMERQALALADAVVSPTHDLLQWITQRNWQIPANCYVQQKFLSKGNVVAGPPLAPALQQVTELVYYGSLKDRAAVNLFCEALDALPSALMQKIKRVTFLDEWGLGQNRGACDAILHRALGWPFFLNVLPEQSTAGVLDYVQQKHRLTVIVAQRDTAMRVAKCLQTGAAFLAGQTKELSQLIAPVDIGRISFRPDAAALAELLSAALTEGVRAPRGLVDERADERAWISLHENLLAQPEAGSAPSPIVDTAFVRQNTPGEPSDLPARVQRPQSLAAMARLHLDTGLPEAAREFCQLILTQDAQNQAALGMMEEVLVQEARLMENLPATPSAPRPHVLPPFSAGAGLRSGHQLA